MKKILIVEDDPMLIEIYSKKFISDGFNVDTANSGAEANEAALKLARKYGKFSGGRTHVISMKDSFHGRTFGSLSTTGQKKYQKNFYPLLQNVSYATFNNLESVSSIVNEETCAIHRPKDRDGSDNANSVATLIEFGNFRFYDAGDLTWNQEVKLVCPKDLIGEVDVYQVTHHGLDTSNNPVVLQTIKPHIAIMNNGHKKGCLPEVFANLKDTKSLNAIYQVHKNLRPDGSVNNVADEFIANHKASDDCDGNYIKLAVAPDAKTYVVSIPSSGHEKLFRTKP
mgnify:CR=1 FL=1